MSTSSTRRLAIVTLAAITGLAAFPATARLTIAHAQPASAAAAPRAVRQPDASAAAAAVTPLVDSVASIGITVGDLDAAIDFYQTVLSFELLTTDEHHGESLERLTGVFGSRTRTATLRLGDERIELTEFLAPQGRPVPTDSRSNDRWFQHIAIVVSDMDRAYAHLRKHDVRHASTGPQTLPAWNPNAGGISAFYFKDPEGHVLEVIHFPPGKGDPKWQQLIAKNAAAGNDDLFLGIDHTAIVVDDTDAALAWYRDVLGLRVAGASENYGPEQERLNSVFGARLRITGLRANHGPGIEFLEYLAPSDGRPYPADTRANDLWHWTIRFDAPTDITAHDAQRRLRSAHRAGGDWVSHGTVQAPDAPNRWALQLRDPDGHALLLGSPQQPTQRREGSTQ